MNPSKFIQKLKEFVVSKNYELDEVFIRRAISALYFSLFIFWANKKYFLENRPGQGSNQDYFPFRMFLQDMISSALDREIIFLHVYRVASDHYALNPTIVKIYGEEKRIIGKKKIEVKIDREALKKAIDSAEEILKALTNEDFSN